MLRTSVQFAEKLKVHSIFRTNINRNLSKSKAAMVDTPVENSIRQNLKSALNPVFLDVINESYMHNVPKGSETHFKVVVVSKEFENMPLLGLLVMLAFGYYAAYKFFLSNQDTEDAFSCQGRRNVCRHRMVNALLESELQNGVHALSIVAKAPSQWDANEEIKSSPKCLGGFGR